MFFLHQREFILNTRVMELIHTTANFNIKDACQGVRLQQKTVSPGRYHLKINTRYCYSFLVEVC